MTGSEGTVEMVLYVAPHSAASSRAQRALDALRLEYDEKRLSLVVRDVVSEPDLAEADQVVFIPTLIVRSGHVQARVVGDLADRSVVTNMLAMGGLEKKE
jgi:hypothetical protein